MRNLKALSRVEAEDRPLWFEELACFAALMTAGTAIVTVLTALVQGGPEVVTVASFLFLCLAAVIWSVTLTLSGLMLIPTWARRGFRRIAHRPDRPTDPKSRLWDDWMDGPP